jgi:hypothetical protein
MDGPDEGFAMKIKVDVPAAKGMAGTYTFTVELSRSDIAAMEFELQEWSAKPTKRTVAEMLHCALGAEIERAMGMGEMR